MDSQVILDLAVSAARVVGRRMREAVAGEDFRIMFKGQTDLVTEVDIWAEEEIKRIVLERCPGHLVVGEETSAALAKERGVGLEELVGKGAVWIVDPIDGTSNFANRIPICAVSLGVVVDGVREVGVIFDPFQNEMFTAVRGRGAQMNEKTIKVSQKTELKNSLLVTGFPHDRIQNWGSYRGAFEKFLLNSRDLRRFGAATIDQCWVACGRLDGFFEYGLKPWDVAAGSLIVEEAGGKIGSLDTDPKFSLFSKSFVFSGPGIFKEMNEVGRTA